MKDLTKGNIYKAFFIFAIPIILSSVLSSMFSVVDTAIAGQYLGSHGLAAVSAPGTAFSVVYAIFFGHAYGLAVYVGNAFGSKEYRRLRNAVSTNMIVVLLASVAVAVLGIVFWRPIFGYLNIEEGLYEDARIYYFFLCVNVVVYMAGHFYQTACNAVGVTTFPLVISILSAVVNLIGNVLTVAVFGWGVFGIGLSTVVSNLVSAVAYFLKFQSYYREMGLVGEKLTIHPRYVKIIFSNGVPNILQQASMYVAGFLTAPLINGLGATALATNSITGHLFGWGVIFYAAAAKTAASYIAQCVGAKKYHKIKKSVGVAFVIACATTIPVMLIIYLFPNAICSLFLKESNDPAVYEYVRVYVRYFLPFSLFNMISGVFHSVFRGIKSNKYLVVSSMIYSTASVLLCFLLIPRLEIYGVFLAGVIAYILEASYCLIVYGTGHWVPKNIRALVLNRKKKDAKNSPVSLQ